MAYGPAFESLKKAQWKVFVASYLEHFNGTQAARDAGYRGSSNASFSTIAADLMRRADIKAAIKEGTEQRVNRMEVTQDKILRELARIAFADPRKFHHSDGSARSITDLGDDEAGALAGFRVVTSNKGEGIVEYVSEVRLADKLQALQLLGKNAGMFKEIVKVESETVTPQMLAKLLQGMDTEELSAMFSAVKLLKPLTDAVRGDDDQENE